MCGINEEKSRRKYFRFPAYSDREGVKLSAKKSGRIIFAGDDFLTNYVRGRSGEKRQRIPNISEYDTENLYTNEKSSDVQRMPRINVNSLTPINRGNTSRMAKYHSQKKSINVRGSQHLSKDEQDFQSNKKVDELSPFIDKKKNRDYELELHKEGTKTIKQQYSGDVDRFRSRLKQTPPLKKKVKYSSVEKNDLLNVMKKDMSRFLLFEENNQSTALQRKDKQKVEKNKSLVNSPSLSSLKSSEKRDNRVLYRGLAGVLEEESKGIEKVRDHFFKE
ncbi:MAG: hypothetical protein LBT69_03455 [Lactobacillales bacterium]|jgi:hypothetical protein|nr:hypothetical protein [Lactobacillales bacterium]